MALWSLSEFLTEAGHLKVGETHEAPGDDLSRIVTALQCWHEVKAATDPRVVEAGLYTVIKECGRWQKTIKLPEPGHKSAVEALLKQALNELQGVSAGMRRALDHIQGMKSAPKIADPGGKMRSLAAGYTFERNYYTGNKKQGRVLSATDFGGTLKHDEFEKLDTHEILQRISVDTTCSVMFLNKIARLRYLVMAKDGLLVDIDYNPMAMKKKITGGNFLPQMYAMDRYGALFVRVDDSPADYVVYGEKGPRIEKRDDKIYMNHSSFLAGREVICAGYLHIGLRMDESGTWKEQGGFLAAISNNSGHYKPSKEDLKRCVLTLQQHGIDVENTRVGFMNSTGNLVFSRGKVFLNSDDAEWDGVRETKPKWAPPVVPK